MATTTSGSSVGVFPIWSSRAAYQRITDEVRAKLPPGERELDADYRLELAKYVDANISHGFRKEYLFSQEPLVRRMETYKPIINSPVASTWREIFQAANTYATALKSGNLQQQQAFPELGLRPPYSFLLRHRPLNCVVTKQLDATLITSASIG